MIRYQSLLKRYWVPKVQYTVKGKKELEGKVAKNMQFCICGIELKQPFCRISLAIGIQSPYKQARHHSQLGVSILHYQMEGNEKCCHMFTPITRDIHFATLLRSIFILDMQRPVQRCHLTPILFFSFGLMGFPEIVAFVDPVQELEDTK